jgi:hypothetical protein
MGVVYEGRCGQCGLTVDAALGPFQNNLASTDFSASYGLTLAVTSGNIAPDSMEVQNGSFAH